MAKYFVGQRVRFIRHGSQRTAHLVGTETRIAGIGMRAGDYFRGIRNGATTDCALELRHAGGGWVLANFDQIEPILPDGHRACDEDFKRDLDRMLEGEISPVLAGAAMRSSDPAPAQQGAAA